MNIDFTNDLEEFDSWLAELEAEREKHDSELADLLETFDIGEGEDNRFQSSGI